jgi:cytochrome b
MTMEATTMNRITAYDLPTRIFHWALAASFLGALGLATLTSDDGTAFPIHALLGLVAVALVVLRLVWGVAGSRYARFGSFELRPGALFAYLRGVIGAGPATHRVAHNPASSWFALAAFACVLGLGATGFAMSRGNESVEEIHEALAWTLLGLVVVHVAGVVLHSLRTKENLPAAMVTGERLGTPDEAIPSVRRWSAAAFIVVGAAWVLLLRGGYDPAARQLRLPLLGAPLQLGEAAEGGGGAAGAGEAAEAAEEQDDDHDEDDD